MFRISLIIPTYNRAAQLIAALQSVVVQDLPPAEWECVVVNNRSDDDTAERFAAIRSTPSREENLPMISSEKVETQISGKFSTRFVVSVGPNKAGSVSAAR